MTLMVGCKLELVSCEDIANQVKNKKVYVSKIYDVLETDLLQIAMPIYEGKMVALNVGSSYLACFYTGKGLYECKIQVTSRYKTGQLFCLEVVMLGPLKKVQRREFFRLDCSIEATARIISDEEYETGEFEESDDWMDIHIADISGGGVKMYQKEFIEPNEIVLLHFELPIDDNLVELEVVGRILRCMPLNGKTGMYDQRVEFMNISKENRDKIVKFIFNEQRMKRAKESGFK